MRDTEAVIAAMATHRSVETVLESALLALRDIARRSPEGQAAVARAGGAEAIPTAMKAHPGNVGVQEAGCRALRNLAPAGREVRYVIADAGGLDRMMEALEEHAQNASLKEAVHSALRSLSDVQGQLVKAAPGDPPNTANAELARFNLRGSALHPECW